MKIAILDDYLDTLRTLPCFETLSRHEVDVVTDHLSDPDALAERLAETEALVLIRERTAIEAWLLERLPKLRLISLRSAYPHVDVEAATRLGILVCSDLHSDTPCYAAAELTWALTLAAARGLPREMASLRDGDWQAGIGTTLRGKTLGIYGYGRIGRVVASFGRTFGLQILTWGGEGSRERAAADGLAVASGTEDLFAHADVLSLHLRLVDSTRSIVGPSELALMKPTSILVNTARAGLIAPGALLAGLEAGRPGMAAIDVFYSEPFRDSADPLLTHPDVVATPHIGYVTREEWDLQFGTVFEQVVAYAARAPINVVDLDALRHPRQEPLVTNDEEGERR